MDAQPTIDNVSFKTLERRISCPALGTPEYRRWILKF
jgi:hypothetical protein